MNQITSTGTRQNPVWLYVREPFAVSVAASQVGAGLTLTARFSDQREGDPAAIHATLENAAITEVDGTYRFAVASALLVTHLGTNFVGRMVHLHLFDNGGSLRDCYSFRVTDTDPDLLGAPPVTPR